MVREDDAIEMVELMLHDACQIASHPFIVLLELFILISDANPSRALHLFVNTGQAEATFLRDIHLRLVVLFDIRVDEGTDVAFVLRQILADDIEVDDSQPNGKPHLRRCQADALAAFEGLVHILYELLQLGIVLVYLFSLLPEHRLTVCVYWQYHLIIYHLIIYHLFPSLQRGVRGEAFSP